MRSVTSCRVALTRQAKTLNLNLINMTDNAKPQLYKVVKIGRKSERRSILRKNLTLDEARQVVNSYPDSKRSIVVFFKM